MKRFGLVLALPLMIGTAAVLALLILHSFGSASCTQGQSGDQPPPAGATAFAKMGPEKRATFLAGWPTVMYQDSLRSLALDPTPELVGFPPGETVTYYPKWDVYLTDAEATLVSQATIEPSWGVIYPPEPPPTEPPAPTAGSVGGLTALTGC